MMRLMYDLQAVAERCVVLRACKTEGCALTWGARKAVAYDPEHECGNFAKGNREESLRQGELYVWRPAGWGNKV